MIFTRRAVADHRTLEDRIHIQLPGDFRDLLAGVPLYPITDVREVTRQLLNFASRVVSSSVIASAKYSCPESGDRFLSGRTASERTRTPAFGTSSDRAPALKNHRAPARTMRTETVIRTGQRRSVLGRRRSRTRRRRLRIVENLAQRERKVSRRLEAIIGMSFRDNAGRRR